MTCLNTTYKALTLTQVNLLISNSMKKMLPSALIGLGVSGAATAQTATYSNLMVTSHIDFFDSDFANAIDWRIAYRGTTLSFFPEFDFQTRSIVFKQNGDASFPRTVSIGDVVTNNPGTLGTNTLTLAVGGKIEARAIYVVAPGTPWPDYVFASTYRLPPLREVERFVRANQHLPGLPSAAAVQAQGLDVGQMESTLLKKVEELTLYLIELRKENDALQARVAKLER